MNGFDKIFSAELGQGTGMCTLVCNVHALYSAALCSLTNTDRSHEHRIHGLGIRLIWVPKAVLQINHYDFRFSFRNLVHIQQLTGLPEI